MNKTADGKSPNISTHQQSYQSPGYCSCLWPNVRKKSKLSEVFFSHLPRVGSTQGMMGDEVIMVVKG